MTALEKKSPFVLMLIATCCLLSPRAGPQAQGQTYDRPQVSIGGPSPLPILSNRAKKQLQTKLESAPTTPLQFIHVGLVVLEINGAQATSIRIEGNYDAPPDAAPMINDYVMKLRYTLVNHSDRLVTGAGLEFTNTQVHHTFFVYPSKIEIEPGKSQKFEIPFMAVTGDPAYLSVQIAGAQFGDGITWGGFPFPQSRLSRDPNSAVAAPAGSQVDSKPTLLNSPQPRYTEDARKNHVLGAVELRLMVGIDGTVKHVNITNALPDGLTEQAVRAAYEMKFKAARKNGQPVEYWMPATIEFNLK